MGSYYLFELKRYFSSSSSYMFMLLALVLLNILTFFVGNWYAQNVATLDIFFGFMPWVLMFLAPALMMSSWPDEYKRGTAEFLFGLPLSLFQVGLSKFLAAWTFLFVLLLATTPMVATVYFLGSPDIGPILMGYLAALLMGGFMLSLAYLGSVISRGQIGAFSLGLLFSFLSVLTSWGVLTTFLRHYVSADILDKIITLSPINRYEQMYYGLLDFGHITFFLSAMLISVFLGHLIISRRHGGRKMHMVSGLWILFAVLSNLIIAKADLRFDLTENKRLSVSNNLIEMAKELPENTVKMTLYYSSSNPDLSLDIKKHAARVRYVLQSLAKKSDGRIDLVEIDPTGDGERTFKAVESGVLETSLPQGSGFFFGLVVKIRDREHAIARLEPNQFNYFEYYLGQLFSELTKTKEKKIGVYSSLDFSQNDARPRFLSVLEQSYDVTYITDDRPELKQKYDAIIVYIAPYLRMEATFALDQYLVKGGRALLVLDPFFRQGLGTKFDVTNRNSDPRKKDHPADILRSYGANYDYLEVVKDDNLAQLATVEDLGDSRYPMWMDLGEGQINYKLPFLKHVRSLSLAEAGHFKLDADKMPAVELTPLLKTTTHSQFVPRYLFDSFAPQVLSQKAKGDKKVRYLAVMAKGKMPSMFDILPDEVQDYYLDYAPEGQSVDLAKLAKFEKESQKEGVMIAIADADFLSDRFSMYKTGNGQATPTNSNVSMMLDMVRYLVGDERLLGLYGRLDKKRNFTLVNEMIARNAAMYQEDETNLMREYLGVSSQMRALNRQTAEQDFINAKLEKKRVSLAKEELQLRYRLRDIREQMRADVESMGQILAAFNLLFAPLVILIFSTIYLYRRRKA